MPKVSIIVPVYNTAKYIKKCLDSILNQTNQDFEIIVIDDGSVDSSAEIIKSYKNEKVKYFYKQNGGISSSRNYGIEKATGDYILFVDSDDYINSGLLEQLNEYIEDDIDIVKFKLSKVNSKYEIIEKFDGPVFENMTGYEAFNILCFKDKLVDSPCVYLYKKSLFTQNNLKFTQDTYHEDFGLIPILIVFAKTVVSIGYFGYFYMQSQNSIIRNTDYEKTIKKANDIILHYDNMINTVNKKDLPKKTLDNIKIYYTNAILDKVNTLKKSDRKDYIKEIKKRKLYKNIKITNLKQIIKKAILFFNIELYIKLLKK